MSLFLKSNEESRRAERETNFALQLKGWRENMENFCGSKPPEGGCGSRQAQGFYPLWQPTASVFHGNRRFADCDPIAQFDRFDPRTTIGLPLEVRAVSRALDFLIPVSEALPQRGTRDSNPQPRVPTRSQNRKRPNAQSHRANVGLQCGDREARPCRPKQRLQFERLTAAITFVFLLPTAALSFRIVAAFPPVPSVSYLTPRLQTSFQIQKIIPGVLHSLGATELLALRGVNSDSGLTCKAASFDGIDKFKVDYTTLHPVISECFELGLRVKIAC
ncbi:Xaa-Pro dipeptidase [Frankliniella fusca]|uniref:Xaa-Pro dipeptidase n=1 Tax=Frankliniella fusca TaxID=407009 RepID=A0AAE1H3R7_9NEOP|nr:Xaa-Pro dipeptidase [Frankliniella fusca]